MKTSIDQVAEFHQTFNHLIADKPSIPPMAEVMFRINFMIEELQELKKAAQENDIVEYADGLGDLQYVLDGAFLNAGLHHIKDAISTEIHRSNMSKACTSIDQATATIQEMNRQGVGCFEERVGPYRIVKRKSDGKVMKAIGYSKPDLSPIIHEALLFTTL